MDINTTRARLNACWPSGLVVATTTCLIESGLNARDIGAGIRYGLLHRIRQGVYIPMKLWNSQRPWDKDKLLLSAHIATSTREHVYSHFSAARLHNLHLWNCSGLIHIAAPYGSSPSRGPQDVKVHQMPALPDRLVHRYISGTGMATFTSMELTVVHCAIAAPFEQAVIIGDSALHKGLDISVLKAMLEELPSSRGIRKATRVINALNKKSESAGESRSRLLVAQLPIEQPELQVRLDTWTGQYRVDFAWRDIKLILEFDGNSKYFDYSLPTEQALLEERERENALIEEGWRFIRIKWKHLANPELLKTRIMNAYLAAAQAAA